MENNSFFEETQANTMECLNQIVVTNHNRQQEIKKWIEQAIHSGKMEYVVAVAEGIPLEKLLPKEYLWKNFPTLQNYVWKKKIVL